MLRLYSCFDRSSIRLWILCCITFFNSLCFGAIVPILYQLVKQYNGSSWHMGIIFALFACAQIVFTPFIGRLADIVWKKSILIASLFGSSCSSLMQAFAPSLLILMIGRFCDGATWSTNSLSQAMISDCADEWSKTMRFGRYHVMYGLWFILWPLIPYIFSTQPLYTPFFFLSFLAVVLGILVMVSFDNDTQEYKEQPIQSRFLATREVLSSKIRIAILILHGVVACIAAMFQVSIQPYVSYVFDNWARIVPLIFVVWGIINCLSVPVIDKISQRFSLSSLLIATFIVRCVWYFFLVLVVDRWFFWLLIGIFAFINICSRSIVSQILWRTAASHNSWLIFGIAESIWGLGMLIWPLVYSGIMIMSELWYHEHIFLNSYTIPFFLMKCVCIVACIYCVKSRFFLRSQEAIQ